LAGKGWLARLTIRSFTTAGHEIRMGNTEEATVDLRHFPPESLGARASLYYTSLQIVLIPILLELFSLSLSLYDKNGTIFLGTAALQKPVVIHSLTMSMTFIFKWPSDFDQGTK
jgi:hypothetical protein